MRAFRLIVVVVLLVGTFYYLAERGGPPVRNRSTDSNNNGGFLATAPERERNVTAAPPEGLDAEERNNIEVYKRVLPAVVNVTSTAVAFDFFYGAVPQQGQGSGFIIDK